ncbi:hypothetical protein ACFFR3_37620 [Nonomuraea salmonea]|uniref:Uncharacterized protein n=1 Tax=Nonomuraea salmonea TaxID=46181 RepID=A0ABV5NZX2_9ACTN
MTGPWGTTTPRGSLARCGVMGLLLLSLLAAGLMTGAHNGWYEADQVPRSALAPSKTSDEHAGDDGLSSLPPQASSVREHPVLTLWPPLRGMRHAEAAHLALLPAPHPEGDLTGDPQQFGHRTAGSRSPPLI